MEEQQLSITCKRTVVSTKPVQPGKTYSFSALDRLMENNHVSLIYYYRSPPRFALGKLRESLSVMLSCFPMVTGRLKTNADGNSMIACNDAGVRMVESKAKGSIEEWLQNVDREKELQLIHWEDIYHKPYFWATFYVQLTEFEGGGLAVGLSCTHLVADPMCATMFIKAWADTNVGGKMMSPPLVHPLPPRRIGNKNIDHIPNLQLVSHYKSCMDVETVPSKALKNRSTVTFAFAENTVRACISMVEDEISTAANSENSATAPSPFEALAGLFWVCISNVKGKRDELVDMSICLDMRRVLALDKGYFGNCMVYDKVMSGKGLEGRTVSRAAMAIRERVDGLNSEGFMDLIEWLNLNKPKQGASLSLSNHDLICVNLESTDPFSAVFEEGSTPMHVSCYVEPICGEGQVVILPWQPKEGALSRLVMVTLPEDEALQLCGDALLSSFSPSILVGVNRLKQ